MVFDKASKRQFWVNSGRNLTKFGPEDIFHNMTLYTCSTSFLCFNLWWLSINYQKCQFWANSGQNWAESGPNNNIHNMVLYTCLKYLQSFNI